MAPAVVPDLFELALQRGVLQQRKHTFDVVVVDMGHDEEFEHALGRR